jgi:hypothetical protein
MAQTPFLKPLLVDCYATCEYVKPGSQTQLNT